MRISSLTYKNKKKKEYLILQFKQKNSSEVSSVRVIKKRTLDLSSGENR